MSKAKESFEVSIKDAQALLDLFNASNKQNPAESPEVLKRAGLIMCLTAWETYVEDRLIEDIKKRLSFISGSYIGEYFERKLNDELKRFHNPSSEKTVRIYKEFLDIDISEGFKFSNYESEKAKEKLNSFISKRGDAVHRSQYNVNCQNRPHLVSKDDLEKAITFIQGLVASLDNYIDQMSK